MKEFPDPLDLRHRGSIAGKIITANPISLPVSPPNVIGIFGAQTVAVAKSKNRR